MAGLIFLIWQPYLIYLVFRFKNGARISGLGLKENSWKSEGEVTKEADEGRQQNNLANMMKLAVVHISSGSLGAAHLEHINNLENLTRNEGGWG